MATTKASAPTFFLNLYADDLDAVTTFYKALDFKHNPGWCHADTTAAFTLPAPNESIALMLLTPSSMSEFIRPGTTVGDATKTTPAVYTLSANSKDEVEEILAKAGKAGAKLDPYVMKDYGAEHGMYCRSFEDPTGHIWEVCCMPAPASA